MMSIRTTLISEQRLCLEALQLVFARAPGFFVAAAIVLDDDTPLDPARADVIVVAGHDADARALSLVERLAQADRGRVLYIGALPSSYEVACLRAAGARGVVLWSQSAGDAFDAARRVAAGLVYTPRELVPDGDPAALARHPLACLTPREREVFVHVVHGCRNGVVARRLGISPKTADTHRAHMMRKLGVHSAVHLVRFAVRHRLLDEAEAISA
ncbi:MAG: response regulator transcription factor [Myxococcales bacterium]|nr:response regulator transcription factor [Myxococcales bacterium]